MRAEEQRENYIPDWLLERYRLGELNPDQRARVENALRTNPQLNQRLSGLERSDQDILEKYPVTSTAHLIRERHTTQEQKTLEPMRKTKSYSGRFAWAPLGMAGLSAAALLCFFLVIVPRVFTTGEQVITGYETGTNRVKGLQTGLHVYMQRGNQAVLLANGYKARALDVLQLGFVAAENCYALILSLDGNGTVTLHLPEDYRQERSDAAPLIKGQGQEILLPYSYKLDSAPVFERFFFVTSTHGFSVSEVIKSTKKLFALGNQAAMQQMLTLPAEFKQYSCVLIKESDK